MTESKNPLDARDTYFALGSRQVVTCENNPGSFSSRLYVNRGETATLTAAKHKTLAGARKWAAKVLTR